MVSPGGMMLTTVQDRTRYNPVFYDWVADWILTPRGEIQFLDLLESTVVAKG